MFPSAKRSLRVSLIAPFLLGLLALTTCLAFYTHSSSYKALQESVRLISRAQTRNIHNAMSLLFRSMTTSVEKLTTDPHVTNLFIPQQQQVSALQDGRENWFEILIQGNEFYRGIMIVDAKGRCLASNSQMQIGISYIDRPYVQAALMGEALLSDVSVGVMTKNLSVTAAAPVFINGEIKGAVVLINDFPEIINNEQTEQDGIRALSPALLAPDGTFVSHRDSAFMTSGKKYPELYRELAQNRSGRGVAYTLEGKKYVGYMLLEPTTGWIICSSGLESEVFSYVTNLTATVVLGSLAALFLISFLVIRVVNGVLGSFLSLIADAKTISEGNLSHKLPETHRTDELGILHAALQTMVASMQKMVVQSQEASKLKSQFLANMSHEIRTPLNAVIGMAYLFLASQEAPEKKRDYIVNIQVAAKSLLGIINNVLDLSKIEAGMFELENIPFNLREAIEQVLIIHQDNAASKGLKLAMTYEPGLPQYFVGDPVRIGQVLNNLTSNALKFTKSGKVSLHCERDTAGTSPGRDDVFRLRIAVADTGIGIPKDKQDTLFKPFTQADASITREFGGTGLGLAISRSIVSMMGGDFTLHSEPGRGTVFCFTMTLALARRELASSTDEHVENLSCLHLEGKRVLVAEDNDINQMLMEEFLRSTGAEVIVVENGLLAVEAVKESHFDLVLMDLQMPVMGGIQASKEIRKFASKEALPIVAVTANAMKEDKEQGVAAGLNDYITKPIDPQQLIMALQQWVH